MKNLFLLFSLLLPILGISQWQNFERNINIVNPSDIPELKETIKKLHSNGTIEFKEIAPFSESEILSLLKIPKKVSFELSRENTSKLNSNITFKKYNQLYDGILIDGAGYTVKLDKDKKIELFTPRILYNITIEKSKLIPVQDCLNAADSATFVHAETLISNSFTQDFRLVHLVFLNNHKGTERIWIDGLTKEVLHRNVSVCNHSANTPTYGTVNLNDNDQGNITRLESPNQDIRIYEGLGFLSNPVNPAQWNENNIPQTTSNTAWGNDALPNSLQNMFSAELVIPEFLNAGIDFGTVNISTSGAAMSFFGSTVEDAYIRVNVFNGAPVCIHDVVAHELGHTYLNQFLAYNNAQGNQALHEGIADIFGTYIESFIQGTADWIMGDDEPLVASGVNRDLSVPRCNSSMPASTPRHTRGMVMGHWFFTLTNGNAAEEVSALGMQTTIEILMEGLNNLANLNAGFPQLREETLLAAEIEFGVCSEEYSSFVNAWDYVCVTGPSEDCPCDTYNEPTLLASEVSNDCPEITVNLIDFYTGNIPTGAILVWSEDDDPTDGIVILSSTIVDYEGTFFAYYYNVAEDCYGPVSTSLKVTIVECCPVPVPDYVYVDENGQANNVFCQGDIVYLDGSASINETRYFLSIWKYNLGGLAAGENNLGYSRLEPSWKHEEVGSMINLNDIWANFQTDEFESGFEYRVQLAVRSECNTDWNVKQDELFYIEFPTPDYTYVDGNGIPTNTFCQGDIVYLDGSDSQYENKYFLSIWQYNIGGHAAGEDNLGYSRLDPSWAQGEVGSMINLNDIWANFEAPEFEGGYEYKVQLAVQGPCDNGWNVKQDELFIVEFPTPDYKYVDAQGNEKDVFCIGETVYLDGSGSQFENKYFLSIWQYNIGGFANGEDNLGYSRLDPSWAQGEVGSLINLNEIWDNFEGDYFEPGYEYKVQLAVQGECDNGWNVKQDELFIVICCDGPAVCEAEFIVNTTEDKEGNIDFEFLNSDEVFFEHTWYVYQHDEQGEGPYTQVAQSNDPSFSFRGEVGGCYTIIHEVVTPCGTCCYSREICNEEVGGKIMKSSNAADCDIICLLDTPTNLSCFAGINNYLNLTWGEVDGADSYIVTMIFNDPDCCGGEGSTGEPYVKEVEGNTIELPFYPKCMSYTVTANCNGNKGQESAKKCFNYKTGCKGETPKAVSDISTRSSRNNTLLTYPNPTSNLVNFALDLEEGQEIRSIELLDVQGRVMNTIRYEVDENDSVKGKVQLEAHNSGIYIIRIQLTDSVITQRVIKI